MPRLEKLHMLLEGDASDARVLHQPPFRLENEWLEVLRPSLERHYSRHAKTSPQSFSALRIAYLHMFKFTDCVCVKVSEPPAKQIVELSQLCNYMQLLSTTEIMILLSYYATSSFLGRCLPQRHGLGLMCLLLRRPLWTWLTACWTWQRIWKEWFLTVKLLCPLILFGQVVLDAPILHG